MDRFSLLLKNVVFTLLIPGTAAVYAPIWLVRSRDAGAGLLGVTGGLLVAAGILLYLWCVSDFARFGRGTPAPIDAPKHLVVRGPYRWVRNPMYVAVLSTIFGWAAVYRAGIVLLYALALGLCFHAFVVFYEEPHLSRLFGAQYAAYRNRVGRWLPTRPR